MKKILYSFLLSLLCLHTIAQSSNNSPTWFTSGLGFPRTTTAPFTSPGFGWWQPTTLKLAIYNGTVWQNLLTETLASSTYVPATRTITINGITFDLSANRSWTISAGGSGTVTSVTRGIGFQNPATSITTTGTLDIDTATATSGLARKGFVSDYAYSRSQANTLYNAKANLVGGNTFSGSQIMSGSYVTSSGTLDGLRITPTLVQSGTAGYRALFVSPYESTVGSGNKILMDIGTNTAPDGGGTHSTKFRVDNGGNVYQLGSLLLGTTPTTSAGSYDILTRNTATGIVEKISSGVIGATFWENGYGTGDRVRPISNRAVDISPSQNGSLYATTVFNSGTGNGLSVGATGIGVLVNNNSSSAQTLSLQNSGSGNIATFTNATAGTRASIDNNGIYQYGADPTANLTANSAVHKGYVDARIAQLVEVAGTTQALVSGTTYILHSGSLTTCTLPTTANVGDLISIIGEGSGGFRVSQNASQFIASGNSTSTVGTGGYIQSTTNNTFVSLRYVNTNKWMITSSNSAITIN